MEDRVFFSHVSTGSVLCPLASSVEGLCLAVISRPSSPVFVSRTFVPHTCLQPLLPDHTPQHSADREIATVLLHHNLRHGGRKLQLVADAAVPPHPTLRPHLSEKSLGVQAAVLPHQPPARGVQLERRRVLHLVPPLPLPTNPPPPSLPLLFLLLLLFLSVHSSVCISSTRVDADSH